jgi:hypothetical protein
MLNNQPLNSFKYFLVCYFNISTNYNDLSSLGLDFRKSESDHRKEELLRELEFLQSVGDWEFVQRFVREYGMRDLNIAQAQEMLDILIRVLLNTES